MTNRIHIFGASGSGTTTLALQLAERLSYRYLDVDDYFWILTNPPYCEIRSKAARLALLRQDLEAHKTCVFSGCIANWGEPLIPLIDTAIFIHAPTETRLQRLRARELARFGATALMPRGAMYQQHRDLLVWAALYDTADEETRSRKRHEAWIQRLPCRVIELENVEPVERMVARILEHLSISIE